MNGQDLKSKLALLLAVGALAACTSFAQAAEKTLIGEGKCEKQHQTAIEVKENGKTVVYHLVANDVSKSFHAKICPKAARVKVTGDVKEVDGEMQLTAKTIELLNKESSR